jgi:magnesium transporter
VKSARHHHAKSDHLPAVAKPDAAEASDRRRHRRPMLKRNEPGASPGTLFGSSDAEPTRVYWLRYNAEMYTSGELTSVSDLAGLAQPQEHEVLWIDVCGLGNTDWLHEVAARFSIHPLAIADIGNVPQRPKTEDYDHFTLCISHMVQWHQEQLHMEQVSLALGDRWVVTFQESDEDGDVFEPVRQRIRAGRGRIRACGADYLSYAILDAIVDGYFPVLEAVGGQLEELEFAVLESPVRETGRVIHELKRTLLNLRRGIWPHRDALAVILRGDSPRFGKETLVYVRDVYDHAVQVVDMVETYREFAASLMDVYLSSVNNRMNEVVKVLTIISTIFLPLSFIAGVYGMNFDTSKPGNMPELLWPYGYEFALGLMVVVAGVMLAIFRRFGWLGTPPRDLP